MDRKKSTSGHTEHLRNVLAATRKERHLSTQDVADQIAAHLGQERMSGETVRQYENMTTNPPIDKFAAWARVLGFRLVVDLDRVEHQRTAIMLRTEEAIEVARLVDAMSKSARRKLLAYLRDDEKQNDDADD